MIDRWFLKKRTKTKSAILGKQPIIFSANGDIRALNGKLEFEETMGNLYLPP